MFFDSCREDITNKNEESKYFYHSLVECETGNLERVIYKFMYIKDDELLISIPTMNGKFKSTRNIIRISRIIMVGSDAKETYLKNF